MFSAKANTGKAVNRPPQQAAFASKPRASENNDRSAAATRGGGNTRGRGGSTAGGGGGGRGGGGGGKVTLRANHFRLTLGEEIFVYQYALTVRPDEVFEASIVHEILGQKNRHLFKILGAYVPSGRMIFTMAPITETVTIETTFKGKPCEIIIEKSTET